MLPVSSLLSPQRALTASTVAAVNHLLAQEAWARDSLARHAGKVARIRIEQWRGNLDLCLHVARDGMLEAAGSEDAPAVTIHVKLADVPLILQQRDRAFSYVRIDGDAEFANTISQLSKGLRWDAEHDLERVVGPIAARRLAGGAREAASQAKAVGQRLVENLAEYLIEEQRMLVRDASGAAFGEDVTRLRDDAERTAKRIARLEQKLAALEPPKLLESPPAVPILPAPSSEAR
jgi:ubiquinone biosynthesis protein UbiJ